MSSIRPHWRIFTWVVVAFNVIMLIWIITGAASVSHSPCHDLSTQTCTAAREVGGGIAVAALIALWVAGDVILGVIWMVTRPRGRVCPACGTNAKRGVLACRSCGHDFRRRCSVGAGTRNALPAVAGRASGRVPHGGGGAQGSR